MFKSKVLMTYFMFVLPRPRNKSRGQKKIKSRSFHQYSWNSEVDTTWISLIGWPHKTSIKQAFQWIPNIRKYLSIEQIIYEWLERVQRPKTNAICSVHCTKTFSWSHFVRNNLINNPRMFNLGIDDLKETPYIPQKNLLLWICCKCLAW